ncbi:Short-chain dehydrogenase/reductase SDR [Penicillium hordei]|uniref:Short-chain dehydrogenase/reductase SDR n=1 Tax=Penicillium hordei TaxID=40994 RepID=A0AAD6E945_9EURO|nr:Short-chain dehydrogenase/reductase SDR [Penicillium hordei]KAJ5604096.1 Short-chain dehydrogenase/reductase SDR [Penicillium hordei]
MPTIKYNPDSMPDLSGKVILITGGEYYYTNNEPQSPIQSLYTMNHELMPVFWSERRTSADAVIQQIRQAGSKTLVTFLPCDLASLASVKQAAETFLAQESRLDILMCNTGIMATPPGLTADGYEIQFGTNHLGHALLIRKLLPLL